MRFKLWLEEQEDKKKIKTALLTRLGLTKNALEDQTIKIQDIDKSRLIQAIETMGLDDSSTTQLKNWLKMYSHSTLQELLNQLEGMDIDLTQDQKDLPSQKAQLPPGEPQPSPQQTPNNNFGNFN